MISFTVPFLLLNNYKREKERRAAQNIMNSKATDKNVV